MNRRDFVKSLGMAGGAMAVGGQTTAEALAQETSLNFKTKHIIWIINGNGSRKSEWYEKKDLSPNYQRLVNAGFVYEEDHNETVSDHGHSWTELLTGNRLQNGIPLYPTPPHYVRKAHGDAATNYWYVNGVSYYRQWRYNRLLCVTPRATHFGAAFSSFEPLCPLQKELELWLKNSKCSRLSMILTEVSRNSRRATMSV